jgi:hypothetical protein
MRCQLRNISINITFTKKIKRMQKLKHSSIYYNYIVFICMQVQ